MFLRNIHIIFCIVFTNVAAYQETIDTILAQQHETRTYILSFPRSGNTWLRYCLEYLTQRPSLYYWNHTGINRPLGLLAGFPIDITKKPFWKVHVEDEMYFLGGINRLVDSVILVVRNPKEAIYRQQSMFDNFDICAEDPLRYYFKHLQTYDTWSPERRCLVYYEDLISKPHETLLHILSFLHEKNTRLDEFMRDYTQHKAQALKLYTTYENDSATGGNTLLFHSQKMTAEERKLFDKKVKNAYPHLWETYLEERYAEENVLY